MVAPTSAADNLGLDEDQENVPPMGTKIANKGKGRAKDVEAPPKAGTAAAANNLALEWVTATLALKDKMDNLWADAFEKDRQFQNATNDVGDTFHFSARISAEI